MVKAKNKQVERRRANGWNGKPFTNRERYMMRKMDVETIYSRSAVSDNNCGTRPRNPAEFRRLLEYRQTTGGKITKYEYVKKAYEQLKKAVVEKEKGADAVWSMYHALKYQGYLQLVVIEVEEKLEGLTEEQIALLTIAEAL